MMISFLKEPTKALEILSSKKATLDYDEIAHKNHKQVFTLSKFTDLGLLKDIQSSLIQALKKGDKFETWKENIKPKLKAKGWPGNVQEGKFDNARLKKIFDNEMRGARARANYESIMKSTKTHFMYVTKGDNKVRPKHQSFNGIILPKEHSFWDSHIPYETMFDFGCRCTLVGLGRSEVEKKGGESKGFGNTKSKRVNQKEDYTATLYEERAKEVIANFVKLDLLTPAKKISKELKSFKKERELYTWQKGLDEMVEEVIVKDNQKYPINFIQVGKMDKTTKEFLKKLSKKDLEDLYFTLSKNNLLHASPKRKDKYNQGLRVEEIKEIVKVLEEAKEVYWDTKEKSLIYFFDDKQDTSKVNKIIIRPNYNLKKFGKTNAVITLGKVNKDRKGLKSLEKIK